MHIPHAGPVRVLLVNIPDPAFSGKGYGIPLGLAYIAAALERAGARVTVLDLAQTRTMAAWNYTHSTPWARREVAAFDPALVGFTGSTYARYNFGFWARTIKDLCPAAKLVVGGPHVTFEAESTLRAIPQIDGCVLGEGEVTAAELAAAVARGASWAGIQGLMWRDGEAIRHHGPRAQIQDLDALPFPARHLFNVAGYDIRIGEFDSGHTMTLMASRGCVGRCKFCATPRIFPEYRIRSAQSVLAEVNTILESYPRVDNLLFYDDTLTAHPDRLAALVAGFRSAARPFRWACWSRADVIDDALLQEMRETGCASISFGIESGSPRMLREIGKGITVDQAYAALEACRRHGIRTRASFICGMPGETFDEARMTIDFVRRAGLGRDASISPDCGLRLYPGSAWTDAFLAEHPDFDWQAPPPGLDYHRDAERRPLAPAHRFSAREIRLLKDELDGLWHPGPPWWRRAAAGALRRVAGLLSVGGGA